MNIEPGDNICVLYGGISLFVLRHTSGNAMYKFLGEAYVHGLMDAEVLGLGEQVNAFMETFIL